jgi:AcrR family transcriptional regulator
MSARDQLLRAAAELMDDAAGAEVSTRSICDRAGVGAPTLYHHFGSKRGLEEAVVTHGFKRFLREETDLGEGDPIDALRRGWDLHVRFGLEHPAFYALIYGRTVPGRPCAVVADVERMLLETLRPAATAGRLRVPPEQAAREILAASTGVVLTLIAAAEPRDLSLSDDVRDAVLDRVTVQPARDEGRGEPVAVAAIALDAALGESPVGLSAGEAALLRELLRRLATG